MDKLEMTEDPIVKDIKLIDGEKIVWAGQPDLNLFRPMDWIAIPFSIVWLSGVVFTGSMLSRVPEISQNPMNALQCVPVLIVLAFLFIGIYNLVGRFIYEYQLKKRTQFVLTNKRAIVTCNWLKRWEKSCELPGLEDIRKIAGKNGRGVIIFDDIPQWQLMQWQYSPVVMAMHAKAPAFFDISNIDKVFRLAQSLSNDGVDEHQTIEKTIDSLKWQSDRNESSPAPTLTLELFGEYLRSGEKLLWSGQPDKNIRISRKPELMGLLGVIISAFVLSFLPWWLINTTLVKTVYSDKLLYCALVWIGSFVLTFLIAFIGEIFARKQVHYAVSDQRVIEIIKYPYYQTICRYVEIGNLRNMIKSLYDDDTGTLYFTPPAKGLAAALFGQKDIMLTNLNSMSRKEPIFFLIQKPEVVARLILDLRQKKGLPDFSIQGKKPDSVPIGARASLRRMGKERLVQPLVTARLFLHQSASAWVAFLIFSVFACIAMNMLRSCNWAGLLETVGIAKTAIAHGSPHYSGSPFEVWAIGVLLVYSIGVAFLLSHAMRGWKAISLLKSGVRVQGTRLPDERVLLCVNNQPAICERNYEFSVGGSIYQVKSITDANQPRQKKVTIVFDPSNPNRAVVLDDLPGCPIISDDDMNIRYSNNQVTTKTSNRR